MAEKITVTMDDGRVLEFNAKQKLIKTTELTDYGLKARLDFVNGKTLNFMCDLSDLMGQFALHGADQKLGDEIAGIKEIDDCVLAAEGLIARLEKGEWAKERSSNGMAGTSVLLKALMEFNGKDVATVKAFLADKTQAQKLALRSNPKIKPIVDRIEAEKAANKTGPVIDTDSLLEELG